MAAGDPVSERPTVSVIVPARNEEACLGACLESLVAQTGVKFEIIVVDDGSTDRTREIAKSFAGVRVVEPAPLPLGWIGKNNALVAGAKAARGEWLLFTDADTVHRGGSLARSVEEARRQKAALLSYSPEQEVHGFWEKAVMPVIFAELASSYRPSDVSDPASSAAAANGQYILISREAYDAVGGHETIATSLLEDVALARAVKASGRKIFFRYGKDAVRTRMYRSFAQLKEGWTKNLALLFPSPGRLALLRLTEFVLIVSSVTVAIVMEMKGRTPASAAVGLLALALTDLFLRRIRKAHFSWDATVLALIGLPLFSYLLLRSRNAYQKGSVTWKGRRYMGNRTCASVETNQVEAGRPLDSQQDAGRAPSHATSI
ncbi:MAG: glycosyltransferase family 2 protein [Terriglobales bacterium]|jgi:cellulose synthase/poly-beta-1,6-N-acetylglucosamine synthase-like glycosyltransferase